MKRTKPMLSEEIKGILATLEAPAGKVTDEYWELLKMTRLDLGKLAEEVKKLENILATPGVLDEKLAEEGWELLRKARLDIGNLAEQRENLKIRRAHETH